MSSASVVASAWLSVSLTSARMIFTCCGVGRQRVGGHHPASLGRELPGDVELVVVLLLGQLEGDQRQLLLAGADQLELARSRRSARPRNAALRCIISMM